jgi:hypothetical protein
MLSTLRAFPSWQAYWYIGSSARVNGTTAVRARRANAEIAEAASLDFARDALSASRRAEFAELVWLCELFVFGVQFFVLLRDFT